MCVCVFYYHSFPTYKARILYTALHLYVCVWPVLKDTIFPHYHRPKHVELIGTFNKQLLLHLVGCLCYLQCAHACYNF